MNLHDVTVTVFVDITMTCDVTSITRLSRAAAQAGRGDGLVEELVVLLCELRPRRAVLVGDDSAEVSESFLQLYLLGVLLAVLQLIA